MHTGESYQTLERQIARIHRVIEAMDAEVTWDDRIPDPDNPKQLRQIDITIRRDGYLTLVECRAWQDRQDVNWIEHLHGRRSGMNADAIIGVSSSGFTDTARLKAQRLGVILRDFETLSPEEIRSWGKLITLMLKFYEFRDVEVTIMMPGPFRSDDGFRITAPDGEPVTPRTVLMTIVEKYKLSLERGEFVSFNARMDVANQRINGVRPLGIQFRGRMRMRQYQSEQPSVAIYGKAGASRDAIEAQVEQFDVGDSQVISGPELSSIVFDLSKVTIPDRCIFGIPLVSKPGGMRIRHVDITGIGKVLESKVAFTYVFKRPS